METTETKHPDGAMKLARQILWLETSDNDAKVFKSNPNLEDNVIDAMIEYAASERKAKETAQAELQEAVELMKNARTQINIEETCEAIDNFLAKHS